MSLKSRLDRLERRQPDPAAGTAAGAWPPQFWQAVCGAVPLEECDPETRRLVESLCGRGPEEPDPIEDAIRNVGTNRNDY